MRMSGYEVVRVETAAELEQVRALRSAAFERELGYDYAALGDDLDERSLILLCKRGDRPVGTARLTLRDQASFEDEAELLLEDWRREGAFDDCELAQCTRLVVAPEFRARGAATVLTTTLYLESERQGTKLVFIDASAPLVPYYIRLGFRHFRRAYQHPVLGTEYVPLVLFVGDAEHFRSIGSRLGRLTLVDDAARARTAHARVLQRVSAAPRPPGVPMAGAGSAGVVYRH